MAARIVVQLRVVDGVIPNVASAQLTEQRIDLAEHEALVASRANDAVVGFVGTVRNHDGGRSVTRPGYSAHPSAAQVVSEIAAEVAAGSRGVRAIAVSHRVGVPEIGDTGLVVAVAADHRATAFETCALLIETVNAQLPVWKRQAFGDGSNEWVRST